MRRRMAAPDIFPPEPIQVMSGVDLGQLMGRLRAEPRPFESAPPAAIDGGRSGQKPAPSA